jgi:hypothetical protein
MRHVHELGFVDPKSFDEIADVRQRRFADANNPYLFGFDQPDVTGMAELIDERGSGHPAGGATTKNHDTRFGPLLHDRPSLRERLEDKSPPAEILRRAAARV